MMFLRNSIKLTLGNPDPSSWILSWHIFDNFPTLKLSNFVQIMLMQLFGELKSTRQKSNDLFSLQWVTKSWICLVLERKRKALKAMLININFGGITMGKMSEYKFLRPLSVTTPALNSWLTRSWSRIISASENLFLTSSSTYIIDTDPVCFIFF